MSSSVTEIDIDVDSEGTVATDDQTTRLDLLRELADEMRASEIFDEEDVEAVENEFRRIEGDMKRVWKQKCMQRLKVLSQYDNRLKFSKHHPELNRYFVEKQRKMISMVESI